MRGAEGKQASNIDDIAESMRKYTDMTEDEIAGFLSTHELNDLVEESGEVRLLDMEESAKLMYKY